MSAIWEGTLNIVYFGQREAQIRGEVDPRRAGGQGGGSGLRSPDAWCVPCMPAWCCQVSGKGAPDRASAPAKAQRCRSHQSEGPATGESRAELGWGGPRQRGDQPSGWKALPKDRPLLLLMGETSSPRRVCVGKKAGRARLSSPRQAEQRLQRGCVWGRCPLSLGAPRARRPTSKDDPPWPLKWTSNLALFLSVLACRPPSGAEF